MDETWRFAPGRGIWSLHRRCDEARLHFCFAKILSLLTIPFLERAGDEARLHFCFAKINVRLRQAVAADSPPDCRIYLSSRRHRIIKKKTTLCVVFYFMERVTRLELATSTLARWRSTG